MSFGFVAASFRIANGDRVSTRLLSFSLFYSGDPALTEWFYGFNSRLVLCPVDHTKYIKTGSGPSLNGTHDEVRTTLCGSRTGAPDGAPW